MAWRIGMLGGTILLTALGLAIAGIWWRPLALVSIPLLLVAWRETHPRGLLDPDPYLKGMRGERQVGEILEGLGDSYRVLNGVDAGRGDVDHVVVGPTGVFAIETKNIAGLFELRHGRYSSMAAMTEATS